MPVDEFGREIPGNRGGQDDYDPPPSGRPPSSGGAAADGPRRLYEALPTSRYTDDDVDVDDFDDRIPRGERRRHHDDHRGRGRRERDRRHDDDDEDDDEDDDYYNRHRDREDRRRKRKHRSESPPLPLSSRRDRDYRDSRDSSRRDRDRRRRHFHRDDDDIIDEENDVMQDGPSTTTTITTGRSATAGSSSSSKKYHPFIQYVRDGGPMLCQVLWQEARAATSADDDDDANQDKDKEDRVVKDDDDDDKKTTEEEEEQDGLKHDAQDELDQLYKTYRETYCLTYVRSFFNQHLDDSWFRQKYSPLGRYQLGLQEQTRARQEAQAFAKELSESLAKNKATSSSSSSLDKTKKNDPCFFVLKARLGGGIRHLHSHGSGSISAMVNPVPASHVLDLSQKVLPVRDVPSHVTDEQLTAALMVHAGTVDKTQAQSIVLHSGPPRVIGVKDKNHDMADHLMRTAYLQAPEQVRQEIIQQLHRLDRGGDSSAPTDSGAHVPRKEDTYMPKTLELVVECSDAYGRTEVDADGHGAEPEDDDEDDNAEGMPATGGKDGEKKSGVTPRKASVWVSTRRSSSTMTHVQVLSATLSTKRRIADDFQAARKLADAYDVKHNIPNEARLVTLLPQAVPNVVVTSGENNENNGPPSPQDVEDALDVTIAYLRRVHLVSFYNGCTPAATVAEVLNGDHPASTVHLRLANADEILEPPPPEECQTLSASDDMAPTGASGPPVDLLVQRLNTSIEKALAETSTWIVPNDDTCIVIDPQVDAEAKEVQRKETQVEPTWIADHTVVDDDGRARCSFHFCRKLFKDANFLRKHLLKKHPEFLRGEIAKVHDPYMMKAWDAEEQRPVPPILVDCGHRFGLVPSPVLGAATPMAADPEPGLWDRLQEEKRREEDRAAVRRERQERQRQYQQRQEEMPEPSLDAALSSDRGTKRPEFVDVDDMQEEKVELALDEVEIPVEPVKKKKKKRKLL